jgi:NhaP-type Na+/H+ or K+/H+ antiporter
MEFVYYTLAGLILYVLSDWILKQIEKWRGEQFEQRTLIFFVIILVLALTSFKAIELLTASS